VDLTDTHNEYFIAKEIDKADKVKKILGGFKCVHIHDWIACEHVHLLTLTYVEFMTELQASYLPSDWEELVRTQILGMQMKSNMKFWDWCQEMRATNIILCGMTSHLSDEALRNQLEASLEPSLCSYVFHEKINKKTVLKEWILAVKEADEKLQDECKCSQNVFNKETAAHNAKQPALLNYSHEGNSSKPINVSSATACKKCAKLGDDEHKLLQLHNRCFKCCRFNQSHRAADCPNGFPDGNMYKKIMPTRDVAGNPPKPAAIASSSGGLSKGKAVTSITPAEGETTSDKEGDFVTAVFPLAVLGNRSFSEEDISPPLCSKHFIAKFKVYGPRLDFALMYAALIDNGAHIVLICPEVVEELGLERHLLPVPEPVDVVITDGRKKAKKLLSHYVKLSVTSMDNAWTSKTVHALIAPGLCMPLILRLPFLIHNDIVTDHVAHSCIDKKTSYNLLHPSKIVPPRPPPMRITAKIKETKAGKRLILKELTSFCHKRVEEGKLVFEDVKDVDMVGAVRDAIENIALKERLKDLEVEIKKDFCEVFEEIPHVKDLPTDYMA